MCTLLGLVYLKTHVPTLSLLLADEMEESYLEGRLLAESRTHGEMSEQARTVIRTSMHPLHKQNNWQILQQLFLYMQYMYTHVGHLTKTTIRGQLTLHT